MNIYSCAPDCSKSNVPQLKMKLIFGLSIFLAMGVVLLVFYKNPDLNLKNSSNQYKKNSLSVTIEELVTNLSQKDSRILRYLRKRHLFPPSTLPYNLTNPEDNGLHGHLIQNILHLLSNKTNGFFIEAGTNDGELLSSTLGLERYFNWTGLCVEPSPPMVKIWKNKHRKAWLANVCLSPVTAPISTEFLHRPSYSIASKVGLRQEIPRNEEKEWQVLRVPCFSIFSILAAMNVNEVDYFNLDVEGLEIPVLKTIPFKEILIRTISVELHPHVEKDGSVSKPLIEFMTSVGYRVVFERYPDFIFVHPSVSKSVL